MQNELISNAQALKYKEKKPFSYLFNFDLPPALNCVALSWMYVQLLGVLC